MSAPSLLRHWHPVALSRELKVEPLGVRACGVEIALFRESAQGNVAAITDICPHRKMRLSVGRVVNGCLQCRYHGWTFDAHCNGESPGTPKMHTTGDSYEAREAAGMIWIRSRESSTEFPRFEPDDPAFFQMLTLQQDIQAPLQLVLDNFNELEHTPTTHGQFGYQLERMAEVELDLEAHDDRVHIRYHGPSKPYPFLFRKWMRLGRHVIHHVDGYTRYSPVHTVGDYRWTDEHSGREAKIRVRHCHFLTPIDDEQTRVFTLAYMKSPGLGFKPIRELVRWRMRPQYVQELREDQYVLERLICKDISLSGLKLSRFDRVMGLNRERVSRIYHGEATEAAEMRN